jgi:hypothetical protein
MRTDVILRTIDSAREARGQYLRQWLRGLFRRRPPGLRIRIEWA